MKSLYTLLVLFLIFNITGNTQNPQVSITTGHSGLIMKVALAPQGNLIATCSADHLIKIWDKSSGKEITSLSNKETGIDNEQRIESFVFFDDGNTYFRWMKTEPSKYGIFKTKKSSKRSKADAVYRDYLLIFQEIKSYL